MDESSCLSHVGALRMRSTARLNFMMLGRLGQAKRELKTTWWLSELVIIDGVLLWWFSMFFPLKNGAVMFHVFPLKMVIFHFFPCVQVPNTSKYHLFLGSPDFGWILSYHCTKGSPGDSRPKRLPSRQPRSMSKLHQLPCRLAWRFQTVSEAPLRVLVVYPTLSPC